MCKKWAVYCSTQMAQCHYWLMLIQLCFHWLLTVVVFISNEKKATADSQHCALFVDCLTDFFTHKCKLSHQSSWANIYFSFDEKRREKGRTSNSYLASTVDSYEGVGMGVWVWVGVRVGVWDMKWFYNQEPISITRAISSWHEEDLHMIWKELSQIPQRPDMNIPEPGAV